MRSCQKQQPSAFESLMAANRVKCDVTLPWQQNV